MVYIIFCIMYLLYFIYSLIFHSIVPKHLGTFFERGWGNSSLKRKYVEGEEEGVYTYKMNRDEQGGAADQKLQVWSKHTF